MKVDDFAPTRIPLRNHQGQLTQLNDSWVVHHQVFPFQYEAPWNPPWNSWVNHHFNSPEESPPGPSILLPEIHHLSAVKSHSNPHQITMKTHYEKSHEIKVLNLNSPSNPRNFMFFIPIIHPWTPLNSPHIHCGKKPLGFVGWTPSSPWWPTPRWWPCWASWRPGWGWRCKTTWAFWRCCDLALGGFWWIYGEFMVNLRWFYGDLPSSKLKITFWKITWFQWVNFNQKKWDSMVIWGYSIGDFMVDSMGI